MLSGNGESVEDAAKTFHDAFLTLVSQLFLTYLLWTFALFIFFPLSLFVSGGAPVTALIGLIFVLAILASAARAALAGRRAIEGLAILVSSRKRGRQARESALRIRNPGYIVLIVALAIVFIPLLGLINVVLGGILLAAALVLVSWFALPLLARWLESLVSRAAA